MHNDLSAVELMAVSGSGIFEASSVLAGTIVIKGSSKDRLFPARVYIPPGYETSIIWGVLDTPCVKLKRR